MSKAKSQSKAESKEPASVPKYEIISGPQVTNALHNAIDQFEQVRNRRTKKAEWKKKSSHDQTKIDYAMKLAKKYKDIAGHLSPASKNAMQALQKLVDEAK